MASLLVGRCASFTPIHKEASRHGYSMCSLGGHMVALDFDDDAVHCKGTCHLIQNPMQIVFGSGLN